MHQKAEKDELLKKSQCGHHKQHQKGEKWDYGMIGPLTPKTEGKTDQGWRGRCRSWRCENSRACETEPRRCTA